VAEPSQSVFLSYASQDQEAAQRICQALRGAGIEVFLDQSELRGGDAWDQRIRREIHDCALFIPIVSQHTQERLEGYFRHEWNLAIERTHHMAQQKPFLVPVVVDGTRDQEAFVPDAFRAVQWTRLPDGDTSSAFVERIKRLLSPELSHFGAVSDTALGAPVGGARQPKRALLTIAAVVVFAALAYLLVDKFWISKHLVASVHFAPPPHSIAVLPFVNLSGDKGEYFSDGLTEEILNSLAQVNDLQVAARTSAFSFKGKDADVGTIAHKLNVAAVLEGSVRRSVNTVRVTVELINPVTGFQLWSQSYNRDLGDVLSLQIEIATAVAGALKVKLLGDLATRIELGGTRNPAAFDAYLRGRKAALTPDNEHREAAIAAYTEAIGLDPDYALAFANRSIVLSDYAGEASGREVRESFDKAQSDARRAIALAPDLAEAHLALASYAESGVLDFAQADQEYQRTLALAPGDARILRDSGTFAVYMGRIEPGIATVRRAVELDPLNAYRHNSLGDALYAAHQYEKAIAAYQDALSLDHEAPWALANRGRALYGLGDFERARASCEGKPAGESPYLQECLALVYRKLGRQGEGESVLKKMQASLGDAWALQYAEVHAQWGDTSKALEWLETALRLRDPGLEDLRVDPLLDPLRKEPRFKAIERQLKFPE